MRGDNKRYKGLITTPTTTVANTNLAFNTILNTNSNTTPDTTNNAVAINKPGYYDLTFNGVIGSTAGATVTVKLMANGVALPGAVSTNAIEANGTNTFTINDVVKVSPSVLTDNVEISVQIDTASQTLSDATLIIEARK